MSRIPELASKIGIAGLSVAAPVVGANINPNMAHVSNEVSVSENSHNKMPESFADIVKKLVESELSWKITPDNPFIGKTALAVLPDGKKVKISMLATTSVKEHGFSPENVFHIDEEVYPKGTDIKRNYAAPAYSYAFNKERTNDNSKKFDAQSWYTGIKQPEYTLDPNPGKNLHLDVNGPEITYQVGIKSGQFRNAVEAEKYQTEIETQAFAVVYAAVSHRNLPSLPEPKV